MRRLSRIPLACVALVLTSTGLRAQVNARVAAVQVWTDHPVAGNPRGLALGLGIQLSDRWMVRIAVDRLGTDGDRIGSPCVDLLLPCPDEPLHDDSYLRTTSIGAARTIEVTPRTSFVLEPALRVGRVGVDTRALQSGYTLSSDQLVLGAELGAELMIVPVMRWPLAVHGALRAGAMVGANHAADAYMPFSGGITLGRVELGLTLGAVRRRNAVANQ